MLISPYKGKDPSFSVPQSGFITHGDTDAPSSSISKVLRVSTGRVFHKDWVMNKAFYYRLNTNAKPRNSTQTLRIFASMQN